jgi:hypothetical protein
VERFARACPVHRLVLDELEDGRLRCPRSPHPVMAWVVVDVATGEVLAAGRLTTPTGRPAATWLGPGLRFGPDVLLGLEPRRTALPIAAMPPAA